MPFQHTAKTGAVIRSGFVLLGKGSGSHHFRCALVFSHIQFLHLFRLDHSISSAWNSSTRVLALSLTEGSDAMRRKKP